MFKSEAMRRAAAGPKKRLGPDPRDPSAYYAMGESWEVTQSAKGFVLSFVSGEHDGREKRVDITQGEADRLKNEPASIDEILRRYGTG